MELTECACLGRAGEWPRGCTPVTLGIFGGPLKLQCEGRAWGGGTSPVWPGTELRSPPNGPDHLLLLLTHARVGTVGFRLFSSGSPDSLS